MEDRRRREAAGLLELQASRSIAETVIRTFVTSSPDLLQALHMSLDFQHISFAPVSFRRALSVTRTVDRRVQKLFVTMGYEKGVFSYKASVGANEEVNELQTEKAEQIAAAWSLFMQGNSDFVKEATEAEILVMNEVLDEVTAEILIPDEEVRVTPSGKIEANPGNRV